ncbi:MAG: hypothetical protein VX583_09615 [Bdellovibrionota bacterium]|nr:hypothetical protein [Pseudobdellovibrionaceae bacterium]|tara:strand:+ start:3634 stop:4017 length:384 start_codon:yes stop_codon:yes gene_type:complete
MENNSDDASSEEKQNLKFVPEPIKRLIAMGVGAAFLTEETVRSILGEVKLPKDVLGKVLEGANRSKEEIVDRVGDELVSIIKKIDFVEEASRFVEGHKFRISAEIEVLKRSSDEESVEVSASTKIKS